MTKEELFIKALVEYDIDYKDWVAEHKHFEVQKTTQQMFGEGLLQIDYSKECRLRYIPPEKQIDVDKFRQYWLKAYSGRTGYASSKEIVEKLLKEIINRRDYTFEQCCKAAKYYVDSCLHTGEYLMKCHNFILNDQNISTLEAIVDDMKSPVNTKHSYGDLI